MKKRFPSSLTLRQTQPLRSIHIYMLHQWRAELVYISFDPLAFKDEAPRNCTRLLSAVLQLFANTVQLSLYNYKPRYLQYFGNADGVHLYLVGLS